MKSVEGVSAGEIASNAQVHVRVGGLIKIVSGVRDVFGEGCYGI